MRLRPMILALLLPALAAADPAVAPTEEVAEADAPPAPPPHRVTLVAPGAGRRLPLRVGTRAGDAWQMQVARMASTSVVVDDAAPVTRGSPEAVQVLALSVDDRVRVRLADADLVGAAVEALAMLRGELADLAGVSLSLPRDPLQRHEATVDGLPEEVSDVGAELLGELGWALALTTIPLPEEPVGVGATWRWDRDAEEEGVPVLQRFEARLTGRDRRSAVVAVSVAVAPKGEAGELEGARLERLEVSGGGTVWLDLGRPLARAADLTVRGVLRASWTDEDDQPRTVESTSELRLTVATRDEARARRPVDAPPRRG